MIPASTATRRSLASLHYRILEPRVRERRLARRELQLRTVAGMAAAAALLVVMALAFAGL